MISFLPRDIYAIRTIGGKFPKKVLDMKVKESVQEQSTAQQTGRKQYSRKNTEQNLVAGEALTRQTYGWKCMLVRLPKQERKYERKAIFR
jgi:hypothetical protein